MSGLWHRIAIRANDGAGHWRTLPNAHVTPEKARELMRDFPDRYTTVQKREANFTYLMFKAPADLSGAATDTGGGSSLAPSRVPAGACLHAAATLLAGASIPAGLSLAEQAERATAQLYDLAAENDRLKRDLAAAKAGRVSAAFRLQPIDWTAEMEARLIAMKRAGQKEAVIARSLGVRPGTVAKKWGRVRKVMIERGMTPPAFNGRHVHE